MNDIEYLQNIIEKHENIQTMIQCSILVTESSMRIANAYALEEYCYAKTNQDKVAVVHEFLDKLKDSRIRLITIVKNIKDTIINFFHSLYIRIKGLFSKTTQQAVKLGYIEKAEQKWSACASKVYVQVTPLMAKMHIDISKLSNLLNYKLDASNIDTALGASKYYNKIKYDKEIFNKKIDEDKSAKKVNITAAQMFGTSPTDVLYFVKQGYTTLQKSINNSEKQITAKCDMQLNALRNSNDFKYQNIQIKALNAVSTNIQYETNIKLGYAINTLNAAMAALYGVANYK